MLRYILVLIAGVVMGGFCMSLFFMQSNSKSTSDDSRLLPVSDIDKEPSVDVSALEERLIRMEGLLFDLQNQNKQHADSLTTLVEKPSVNNVADESQSSEEIYKANQAYENYLTHIRNQVAEGVWGPKQHNELAEVLPILTEEQKQSVLTQIVQAHKAGELRPELSPELDSE